ncbi:sensor histidine kinase [Actinoplanes sp. CA-030573]|uniref:sensor histidine kinase n=1 Tax=Actinoplanes sp. CA-030573 TaxID=3239898 RepID=UPI003D930661
MAAVFSFSWPVKTVVLSADAPRRSLPSMNRVLRDELRALWTEPRAPDAPVRVWRDWLLLAAGLLATALEGVFRAEVTWRPFSVLVTVGLCLTTLWRRTRPLEMVLLAFGGGIVLALIDLAAGHARPIGLYAGSVILVLVYALTRWGSGRDIVLGSAVVLALFALSTVLERGPVSDVVGGLSVLTFPGALGAMVRLRSTSRRRELETMRARERESLARELHDTVAHHVSSIVVRAQAGRVLAGADPTSAVQSLAGVEEEGARTLEAMRAMVTALREDGAGVDLAPLPAVADLRRLAGERGSGPPVDLHVEGTVETLPAPIASAVFRIVQESVTNATRHATGATVIRVDVAAGESRVRVDVRDDGKPASGGPDVAAVAGEDLGRRAGRGGYGLRGLRERAALLGGTLRAGPRAGGGWLVEAELPRDGVPQRRDGQEREGQQRDGQNRNGGQTGHGREY